MRKSHIPLFGLLSILLFLSLSCTPGPLKYGEPVEDEVERLIRNAPSAPSYPDAGILNLLDEGIVEVFEDGRSKETLHAVFKILRERGKDNADIEIGYNSRTETASIIYARTVTPEGKIVPLKENAVKVVTPFNRYPSYGDYKRLTFSMPGVTVGSIIDYKVVRERKTPEMEGNFSSHFYFQWYDPTLLGRYKVITPKTMNLKYLVLNPLHGVQSSPRMIFDGDRKIYLWKYENIPQIIGERSMPPIEEVAFHILVTTVNSWEEFFHWWKGKIEGKTEPDKAIQKKVAKLTRNLSTLREKAEAIFDYVKREVRYVSIDLGKSGYEPRSAGKVFENRYGDCKDKSTLLISMLKVAGIPGHYVLIPTIDMGNLIKEFPYPFQFDHAIVAIEHDGGYDFVDPVADTYRFNDLPFYDRNRDALIFKDEKTIFFRTPLARPEENASTNRSQIRVGPDGSIEGETRNSGLGGREASYRSFFIDNSPTKIKEALEKRVHGIASGAKLLEYTHSNPLNFKDRFEVKIRYGAQDYLKKGGDILIFDLPEIRKGCSATDKEERRYPIVIWNNSSSKDEVAFNVPEGAEVFYLPEPVEVKNPYFEFRSSYRQEGDRITYQGEFIRRALRIPPEEYDFYQDSCQAVEKSFNRNVLFRKKNSID
jgi:transglutaminase-like putative cysteine protease